MIYNMMQHIASHCNALCHTATRCNTLHHTVTHCNTLQHTATHCNTLLQCSTHCNTPQHNATHCNTLPHRYLLLTTNEIQRVMMWREIVCERGVSESKSCTNRTTCLTLQAEEAMHTYAPCRRYVGVRKDIVNMYPHTCKTNSLYSSLNKFSSKLIKSREPFAPPSISSLTPIDKVFVHHMV